MTEKLEMIENLQFRSQSWQMTRKDEHPASCLPRCFPGEKRGTWGRVPQPDLRISLKDDGQEVPGRKC